MLFMRGKFLAVLLWAAAKAAARVAPGCQGLGQPFKPGQTQTLLLQEGTEIWPGPSPTPTAVDRPRPHRPTHPPPALLPCLPWLFPTPGACTPQGWLLACPQLPVSSPRGGPNPAAGAPSCRWRLCSKAKPWWLGTMAVPETAPQTPQVGCHGSTRHRSGRGHSQAPWGFALQLCQCLPLRLP